jgi:hypothetical protein
MFPIADAPIARLTVRARSVLVAGWVWLLKAVTSVQVVIRSATSLTRPRFRYTSTGPGLG